MITKIENIREFTAAYETLVMKSLRVERVVLLKRIIGLPDMDEPFVKGRALVSEAALWRAKPGQETDSESALLRERIAAFQALHGWSCGNMRDADRERTVASLLRLLFVEALPETLRTFVRLDPGEYFGKLGMKTFGRARAAFETMLPERLNVSEIRAPGIGITRHGLGSLIERAQSTITQSGGF